MTDETPQWIREEAMAIEETLEGFGIKAKVMEIDCETESNLFALDISQGVRVEEIEALSKTLAMRLGSKTGVIEIIPTIPGRKRVGVRVPSKERVT